MELNEFLEKFLPDAYKRQIMRKNGCHSYESNDLIEMFKYALQKFADKLCEKQRKKVADCFEKFPAISLGILELEQPKIEEL